jgi:protein-disulfide isomerase
MARRKQQSRKERREQQRANQQRQRIYIALGVIAIVVIGALLVWVRQPRTTVEDVALPENLTPPPGADGKAWGPSEAPVVIEEFSDFQWPFCKQFADDAGRQLEEVYAGTGQVRFEYKHFPVIGEESRRAAEAAECAAEQGQFWAYHDTLFLNQQGENLGAFNDGALKTFASAIGLDETAFNECLDSDRYEDVVSQELAEGQEREVQSTPTLFINGEQVVGVVPFSDLQAAIQSALNQ